MQVLMMPDYRIDNPYQTLLSNALQQEGVTVKFPVGYRRVLPIYRAIKNLPESTKILHLHWIDPYIKGNNIFVKFIYCIKFLVDITLTQLSGVKVVWTVHNLVSHSSKFPRLELWTQRMLANRVNRVIVHHTSAVYEVTQQYKFSSSKVEVIPIGHYRDIYEGAICSIEARQKLGLPESSKIYLNLGILKPYKGIERLVQTWKDNQTILSNNTLLIAGKALDDRYGRTLVEQASEAESIILQNIFVEDDQIHLYFSAADVVVLPFERILTTSSLVLAMSYGKPVIAPRLGNIPETVGAADRLLYDPNEKHGLLHAIKESTQIDLEALGQLTNKMCDRLNWGAIGQKTAQLYQIAL
ncbi:glycosyltransferase [Leptolyngbya sp. FACHB-541]|uniref:glycosyltransferase n=1 Tax=Leptolyngbya sp. FACHB-541 TaxID=2692810 RepID=UPI0016848959|nr:glycosyltransferase [Leptolyngbya sp. FACHB-541]MBD2001067.1 glycosyltransferase [Leptolyngbya sp. FACHB-541]